MGTIVDYLCRYTSSLAFTDLPAEVVHQAKRLLVDTLGEDQVMVGSDYPYPLGERPAGQVVRDAAFLTAAQREKIMSGNARATDLSRATGSPCARGLFRAHSTILCKMQRSWLGCHDRAAESRRQCGRCDSVSGDDRSERLPRHDPSSHQRRNGFAGAGATAPSGRVRQRRSR